jgi:glycosyltransferase involved in cell wall biosynthesis
MVSGRRKICFVLPSLAGGGAERAAVQILNALDPAAWDRSMYLFTSEGPYLADVSSSVRLHAGDQPSRVGRWRALRQFVIETRPEIVVSFLSYFTVLSAVRAARVGARVVFNQQTPMSAFLADGDYPWRRRWHRHVFAVATRAGYAAADLIVTTSQGVADDLVAAFGVARTRVRVVHNPVDLDAVAAAAQEPLDPALAAGWRRPVIVAAGRLAEAKNYPLLIEALALLRQRVAARLFILGQGDEERPIRALVADRGLDDAVTLCGFQSNPWKYIARADVFALSSRYEGFGNVLVEAMACGTPVIAYPRGSVLEIVEDGVSGFIVGKARQAAQAALAAPALSRQRCREYFERRFSAARMGEDYLAVYDRIRSAEPVLSASELSTSDQVMSGAGVAARYLTEL